ncbi:hypothetical protein [Streptomyces sp. NPDC094472]
MQHRFTRLCELTGHDIRRPEDAALIALALRAREPRDRTEETG